MYEEYFYPLNSDLAPSITDKPVNPLVYAQSHAATIDNLVVILYCLCTSANILLSLWSRFLS